MKKYCRSKCSILLVGLLWLGCGNAQTEGTRTAPTDDPKNDPDATSDDVDVESNETGDKTDVFADVTGVTATGDPGAYTFAVTVASEDVDCTQYADWWEVISESGELHYRRILAHSHTAANGTGNPFTRDGGPVPVQADDMLIIRAHMNTVGYKGKVMKGSVAGGFTPATDIASDFAADLESAPPLPAGCAF